MMIFFAVLPWLTADPPATRFFSNPLLIPAHALSTPWEAIVDGCRQPEDTGKSPRSDRPLHERANDGQAQGVNQSARGPGSAAGGQGDAGGRRPTADPGRLARGPRRAGASGVHSPAMSGRS